MNTFLPYTSHELFCLSLKPLQLQDNAHLTWPVVTSPPARWVPSIPHVWHFISFRSYCGVTFLLSACVSSGPQRRHTELPYWDGPGGLDSTISCHLHPVTTDGAGRILSLKIKPVSPFAQSNIDLFRVNSRGEIVMFLFREPQIIQFRAGF